MRANGERMMAMSQFQWQQAEEAVSPDCQNQVFDRSGLICRLGGRDEHVQQLLSLFIRTTADSIAVLRRSVQTGDCKAVSMQAHAIKGAAASIGAEAIRSIAAEMEEKARAGHTRELVRCETSLETAFSVFQSLCGLK